MKSAIRGATPSGLACAISLERNGLAYDLFEGQHRIGSPFHYASVWLTDHHQGIDWIEQVGTDTGFQLEPLAAVKRIIVTTPNKEEEYSGALGWIVGNGQAANSLSGQLAAQLKQEVLTGKLPDLGYLKATYDAVVACEQPGFTSSKYDNWKSEQFLQIRGMTALGDFDKNTVYIRHNLDYCPNGMIYMIPMSDRKVSIALCVPNVTSNQLNTYWETFLTKENIYYKALESFEFIHQIGRPIADSMENLHFAEFGSGFYDPFFGWGQAAGIAEGYKVGLRINQQTEDEFIKKFSEIYQTSQIWSPLETIEKVQIPRKGGSAVGTDEPETDRLSTK